MRTLPKLTYSGLTILLSHPSRKDQKSGELLSGYAGDKLNEFLEPEINRWQCDIRTADEEADLLPNTKALLILGEDVSCRRWIGHPTKSLLERRGIPYAHKGIPTIGSIFPQDAVDRVDWEAIKNPQTDGRDHTFNTEEGEEDEDEGDVKRQGNTRRKNFGFWLWQDVRKIKDVIFDNDRYKAYRQDKQRSDSYGIKIFPNSQEIIDFLLSHENDYLYLDIETDLDDPNMFCVGVAFDNTPVYTFPVLRYNYQAAYHNTALILRALSISMGANTVVCHNGYTFDLLVLANKYKLPFGRRHYDTLLAQHRIYPESEKSLGHLISMYLWQDIHKGDFVVPYNQLQEEQLWNYNAKDVATMRMIKWAQDRLTNEDPGLQASIAQTNRCIRPYIIASLTGMRYDPVLRQTLIDENDLRMMDHLKMMSYLTNIEGFKPSGGKGGYLVPYFIQSLGYKVFKKTPAGQPSIDAKVLQKMRLKYPEQPMLPLILKYRKTQKQTSMLNFEPFKI